MKNSPGISAVKASFAKQWNGTACVASTTTHLQPLVSQQLHVSLDGACIRVGNLCEFPLQVLHCADELVHCFLFFSQLGLDRVMLEGQRRVQKE